MVHAGSQTNPNYKVSNSITQAVNEYNQTHSVALNFSGDIPVYLLALHDSAGKLNLLNTLDSDYKKSLVMLNINGDQDTCIFFYDFYGYGDGNTATKNGWHHTSFTTQSGTYTPDIVSRDGDVKTLNMALYKEDHFDDFNKTQNPFLHAYGNQEIKYTKYVTDKLVPKVFGNDLKPFFVNSDRATVTNEYVTAMRKIFYEMALGSIVQTYHLNRIFYVFNPVTLKDLSVACVPPADGKPIRSSVIPYFTEKKIGYKNGVGNQLYHLKDNQMLITNRFAKNYPLLANNKFRFFFDKSSGQTQGETYSVVGKTSSQYSDGQTGSTAFVTNNTYNKFVEKVKYQPNTRIYNLYTGKSFLNTNQLNINFNSEIAYEWGNGVVNASGAGSLFFQSSKSKLSYLRTSEGITSLQQEQFLINSAMFATGYLVLVSAVALIIIITNRIIKQNARIIGILIANGYRKSPIIVSFIVFFLVIFAAAMILGMAAALGINTFLQ